MTFNASTYSYRTAMTIEFLNTHIVHVCYDKLLMTR